MIVDFIQFYFNHMTHKDHFYVSALATPSNKTKYSVCVKQTLC
jgi:hypothetical protein